MPNKQSSFPNDESNSQGHSGEIAQLQGTHNEETIQRLLALEQKVNEMENKMNEFVSKFETLSEKAQKIMLYLLEKYPEDHSQLQSMFF